jgi:hypothetical protein
MKKGRENITRGILVEFNGPDFCGSSAARGTGYQTSPTRINVDNFLKIYRIFPYRKCKYLRLSMHTGEKEDICNSGTG